MVGNEYSWFAGTFKLFLGFLPGPGGWGFNFSCRCMVQMKMQLGMLPCSGTLDTSTVWKCLLACAAIKSSVLLSGDVQTCSLQTGYSRGSPPAGLPQPAPSAVQLPLHLFPTATLSYIIFSPLKNLTRQVLTDSYHLNRKDWSPQSFDSGTISGPTELLLKNNNRCADAVSKTWQLRSVHRTDQSLALQLEGYVGCS